jgi:hypothetical protein
MRKANAKPEPVEHASGASGSYLSADERRAAGKALRDKDQAFLAWRTT